MAAKPLDLHPEALEEWKSAVAWYLERNETAAVNFVAELRRVLSAPTAQ
ncbi:MAG TPA: type II toxin-antitoxin system RelE/ParE family toxin [Candidatus Acidoferrum sp.]|jgi:hypothetical protein|nr:type II toxin-antitoxin system RelE/ParE family toxin [Candidatus Acidoferrum sp.]